MLSNGKAYAIQILVARDLNLNPCYTHIAENYLNKKSIEPFLIGRFALEASKCVKLINQNNLVEQANKLTDKYL